jgi:hypothetical protein
MYLKLIAKLFVVKTQQAVEKPLYVPSEPRSRAQRPRHCSVLALMSRRLDAVLDYRPFL